MIHPRPILRERIRIDLRPAARRQPIEPEAHVTPEIRIRPRRDQQHRGEHEPRKPDLPAQLDACALATQSPEDVAPGRDARTVPSWSREARVVRQRRHGQCGCGNAGEERRARAGVESRPARALEGGDKRQLCRQPGEVRVEALHVGAVRIRARNRSAGGDRRSTWSRPSRDARRSIPPGAGRNARSRTAPSRTTSAIARAPCSRQSPPRPHVQASTARRGAGSERSARFQ